MIERGPPRRRHRRPVQVRQRPAVQLRLARRHRRARHRHPGRRRPRCRARRPRRGRPLCLNRPSDTPEALAELAATVAQHAAAAPPPRDPAHAVSAGWRRNRRRPMRDADRPRCRTPHPRVDSRRPRRVADSSARREVPARPAPRLVWILDPLDGTVNFIYGLPASPSASLPRSTARSSPGRWSTWWEERLSQRREGRGATVLTDQPITPSPVRVSLARSALVTTGFSYRSALRAAAGIASSPMLLPVVRRHPLLRVGGVAAVLGRRRAQRGPLRTRTRSCGTTRRRQSHRRRGRRRSSSCRARRTAGSSSPPHPRYSTLCAG